MKRADFERHLRRLWYGGSPFSRLLLPLSWLYCAFVLLRRKAYLAGLLPSKALDCQVVVVGNLVVGGSGKTPLVIALANILKQRGLRVGILCRGYRGRSSEWPVRVREDSDPDAVGDEAVLLALKTGVPVMAGPDRVAAGRALLETGAFDVLLCDDGLQHYRLRRDIEIVVVDTARGYGNGACLPAGPLRETPERLQGVDAVVALGGPWPGATATMHYAGDDASRLIDPRQRFRLEAFAGQMVHAVAGIAHPQRFFRQLLDAGIDVRAHAFDDHHRYQPVDLAFTGRSPVFMTEKDAVKCRSFRRPDWWVVPLEVRLDQAFEDWLVERICDTGSRQAVGP
jgi:tetraacyldisaccharide 4'-kinase